MAEEICPSYDEEGTARRSRLKRELRLQGRRWWTYVTWKGQSTSRKNCSQNNWKQRETVETKLLERNYNKLPCCTGVGTCPTQDPVIDHSLKILGGSFTLWESIPWGYLTAIHLSLIIGVFQMSAIPLVWNMAGSSNIEMLFLRCSSFPRLVKF